ncbi:MAG: response regulator [Methylococcales bacterium]|nr:response regulator [Methylococcales bacterium]
MNPNPPQTLGNVMIVDDTPGNLALLSDTLSEAGYRVLVATDGLSALAQIDYLKPDIILLDVMMPGIDGFETCHRLKANPETATIPVLFMTALSELDNLLRGFDEGAVDYLVKPVRPPEVLARVAVQLNQVRTLQRAEDALKLSPVAVLAIDAVHGITWLSPSAQQWLDEFSQKHGLSANIGIGDSLPKPLLDWLTTADKNEGTGFNSYRAGTSFSAKLSSRQAPGESILMLEKQTGEWDLEVVKLSSGLTSREAEILMWVSRGKTNKEVGIILGSSPRTINKHLEHIFEKLGVVTRAAAVSKVLQRKAV